MENFLSMSASIYILRFSRLYPLYFVTFIFVAILQMMAYSTRGAFIIYPMNNLRHFFLSLFFCLELGFAAWFFFQRADLVGVG